MNALAQRYSVVCLSETHVQDALSAELLFFQHVQGVVKFYGDGCAILINETLAREYEISAANVHNVIESVAMAISWVQHGIRIWVLHFRLCAFNEGVRCQQLHSMQEWMRTHVGPQDKLVFGGDRNFTCDEEERQSSRTTPWRPSHRMNAAWSRFLASCGGCVVAQAEMTWSRYWVGLDGRNMHPLAILDVVGTNAIDDFALKPVATRVDDVPAPTVSDHFPVAVKWLPRNRARPRGRQPRDAKVRRALPAYLFEDVGFVEHLKNEMDPWFASRPAGLQGLAEFSALVYDVAQAYLCAHIVPARTVKHKLATAGEQALLNLSRVGCCTCSELLRSRSCQCPC